MKLSQHQAAWASRLAHIAACCAAVGIRADATGDDVDAEIAELRRHQELLIGRSSAVLASADTEQRELNDNERQAIRRRTGEVERIEAQIETLTATASQPRARLTPANSAEPLGSTTTIETAHAQRRTASAARPASGRFADLFESHRVQDTYAGRFSGLGDFGLAVASGTDSRLIRPQAGMTEATGVGGGFIVPVQYMGEILDAALATEVVRPQAMVLPMYGKEMTVGLFDHQDGTDGKAAGLQLKWGPEATTLPEQSGKLREMSLVAKKGNIYVRCSNELAGDAVNFGRQLSAAMIAAVASGLDYAFFQGTGVGQPLGVIPSPATITVSKEGGQGASTLMLQNLAKMLARLSPRSYARSSWFAHPTLLPLLYQMAVVIKNVAGTENVGGGSAGVTVDGSGNIRIYGRPVVITDSCSVLSSLGDIVLADWSAYVVGLRADASIVRDTSVHFDSDETAFRLILRLDGQPMNSAARKLRDGTNTVAPFVTLEAR